MQPRVRARHRLVPPPRARPSGVAAGLPLRVGPVGAGALRGRTGRARAGGAARPRSPRAGAPLRGARRRHRTPARLRVLPRDDSRAGRRARPAGAHGSLPLSDARTGEALGTTVVKAQKSIPMLVLYFTSSCLNPLSTSLWYSLSTPALSESPGSSTSFHFQASAETLRNSPGSFSAG